MLVDLCIVLCIISPSFNKFSSEIVTLLFVNNLYRLQAQVQPITRSLLRIEFLTSGGMRRFTAPQKTSSSDILVEDVESEVILFHDNFVLRQRYTKDEHNVTLTVPMFEPGPPNFLSPNKLKISFPPCTLPNFAFTL